MNTLLDAGVWNLAAHLQALDAAFPRFTADGRWRIAYTLPSGEVVRVSPHPGAVKIKGWLFPLSTPVPQQQVSGDAASHGIPHKTGGIGALRATGAKPGGKRLRAHS